MQYHEGEFQGERGTRIWYQSWRPDAPKAILAVVHGLGEHSGRYRNVVDYLVPRGYAVYALDLPGHGRSGGRRGHIGRFADFTADVGRLVKRASGNLPRLPVFLLGHGLGGPIAFHYALEQPDSLQGLITSSPVVRPKLHVPVAKRLLVRIMAGIWPTFAQHSALPARALSHDPQVVAAYMADPLVHDLVTARLAMEMLAAGEAMLARAQELRVPLLALVSGGDIVVDVEASKEFFSRVAGRDKALHDYPGFLHEGHNEVERERPLADLANWLDAHVRSHGVVEGHDGQV